MGVVQKGMYIVYRIYLYNLFSYSRIIMCRVYVYVCIMYCTLVVCPIPIRIREII